ncbi:hypothetical protein EDC04DRAFT_3089009 [Pisolithus marmoratus]|nr:hypothetical protein EDC04DRAFT_3089009 [Pisolithus marmoratus]
MLLSVFALVSLAVACDDLHPAMLTLPRSETILSFRLHLRVAHSYGMTSIHEQYVYADTYDIHMSISQDNLVFNAICALHPLTPIQIFGGKSFIEYEPSGSQKRAGHSYIRDCQQYDGRSLALDHRWIVTWCKTFSDLRVQQALTYHYRTETSNAGSDTLCGRSIRPGLEDLAVQFNLSAAPTALSINNSRTGIPNILITNSGELPLDVFKGLVSPQRRQCIGQEKARTAGSGDRRYAVWLEEMFTGACPGSRVDMAGTRLSSRPDAGVDILHTAVPYYSSSDYIGSATPIDLVFIDFIVSDPNASKPSPGYLIDDRGRVVIFKLTRPKGRGLRVTNSRMGLRRDAMHPNNLARWIHDNNLTHLPYPAQEYKLWSEGSNAHFRNVGAELGGQPRSSALHARTREKSTAIPVSWNVTRDLTDAIS